MLNRVEKLLWVIGASVLLTSGVYGIDGFLSQRARLAVFNTAIAAERNGDADLQVAPPNRADWSAARVRKFLALQPGRTDEAQAVLRIPELDIEAEIFGDTGDRSLDLGVGHIEGTAEPGQNGNVGIAGHRDGYFRRLKDVRPGQRVQIVTRSGRWEYVVDRTRIVDPGAVEVLAQRAEPTLTLVTCYPFYFLGSAPKRFIVHARRVSASTATPPEKRT